MFLPLATSGCTVPVDNFWKSILLYHNRPNVVNKRIVGVQNLYVYQVDFNSRTIKSISELFTAPAILYEIRKSNILNKNTLSNLILNLLKPYDKNVVLNETSIDQCSNLQTGIFVSVRLLLPRLHSSENCIEIITLNKNNNIATFIAVNENNKQALAPPFQYHIELMSSNHIRLIVDNIEDAESSSAEWLCDKLFLKLVKWAEEYDSETVTQPSISLVSISKYSKLYRELKEKYGQKMVKVWPENTDPLKFVYEDIAIATYLICLWNETTPNYKPSFVDLGCGNGLLVYILQEEGYPGFGIDIRKRKIWDLYPSNIKLEVKTIIPSSSFLFPSTDWIIGNHSDELTPWIPVITSRSSYKTNFFLLPCCFYDFSGKKYSRMQTSKSQYYDYLEYIQSISDVCGFITKQDKLRIPSTKRICIVSFNRTYEEGNFKENDSKITELINSRFNISGENFTDDMWLSKFKARADTEIVRNCTKIDQNLKERLVMNIVMQLLQEECNDIKPNGEKWNRGGKLELFKLVENVPQIDLKQLKKECGGLQTLLRNHRYIFDLTNGTVKLRSPPEFQVIQKYKSKPCWFLRNHPQGCLHDTFNCAYSHE